MRISGGIGGVALAAMVVAVCFMAWLRIRQLEEDVALQTVTVETVARRARLVDASAAAWRESAHAYRQAAEEGSNRLAVLEKGLADERGTHEPLRQQIERMMQQEIVSRGLLDRRDQSIREQGETVKKLRRELEDARRLTAEQSQRLAAMASEVETRTQSETTTRQSLEASRQALAAAEAERDRALASLRESERKLEDLQARSAMETNTAVKAGL